MNGLGTQVTCARASPAKRGHTAKKPSATKNIASDSDSRDASPIPKKPAKEYIPASQIKPGSRLARMDNSLKAHEVPGLTIYLPNDSRIPMEIWEKSATVSRPYKIPAARVPINHAKSLQDIVDDSCEEISKDGGYTYRRRDGFPLVAIQDMFIPKK